MPRLPPVTTTLEPPGSDLDPGSSSPAARDPEAGTRMVRMAAALLTAQATTWLVAVLNLIFTARFLGVDGFGILTTAGTVAGFTLALGALGTTNYLIKGISRAPARSARLVASSIVLRMGAWLVAASLVVPIALLGVEDERLRWALIVLVAGAAFDLIRTAVNAALQAHYLLGRAAVGQSVVAIATQAALIGLLVSGQGVRGVVFVIAVGAGVSALGSFAYYARGVGGRIRAAWRDIRAVATGSLWYLAWDAALLILGSIDILMLAILKGPDAAGFYGLALRLAAVSAFVHVILSGTVFPALAAAGPQDPAYIRGLLSGAVRILLVATMPIAVGIALLSDDLTYLVGGDAFAPARPVVLVMAGVVPLIGLDTVLGTALLAVDRQRQWITVAWGAALFNIGANLFFIPLADQLWGNAAVGAAITTVLSEVIMGAAAWRLLRGYRDARSAAAVLARVLLACGAMVGPVILVRDAVGFELAVLTGVAVYSAACVTLRLVTRRDLAQVTNALGAGH